MAGDISARILNADEKLTEITGYDSISYTPQLNGVGYFTIIFKAESSTADYAIPYMKVNGSGKRQGVIFFYKGGNLEFKGFNTKLNYDSKGRLVMSGLGTPSLLKHEKITNSDKKTAETMANRLTYVMDDSTLIDVTAGSTFNEVNAPEDIFKDDSILDGLIDLIVKYDGGHFKFTFNTATAATDKDHLVVKASLGTSSVKSLTRGIDFALTQKTFDVESVINKVTVIGRTQTDGTTPESTVEDAGSIASYGERRPRNPIVDKTCNNATDCGKKATQKLQLTPKEILHIVGITDPDSFDFVNTHSVGNLITITDIESGFTSATLRIQSYTRTIDKSKNETLSFETTTEDINYSPNSPIGKEQKYIRDGAAISASGGLTGSTGNDKAEMYADKAKAELTIDKAKASLTMTAAGGASDNLNYQEISTLGSWQWKSGPSALDLGNVQISDTMELQGVFISGVIMCAEIQNSSSVAVPAEYIYVKARGTPAASEKSVYAMTGFCRDSADITDEDYPSIGNFSIWFPFNMRNKYIYIDFSSAGVLNVGAKFKFKWYITLTGVGTHTHPLTEPNADTGHDTTYDEPNADTGHNTALNEPNTGAGHPTDLSDGTGSANVTGGSKGTGDL